MSKKEVIDAFVAEVMKEISIRVREIIREEVEIETRRLRKKIIREVNTLLTESRTVTSAKRPVSMARHAQPKPAKIETGDSVIDEVLKETEGDPEMIAGIKFPSATKANPFQQVIEQINEERRKPSNGNSGLWKPPPGEPYNFDPMKMDAAAIDWSNMVDVMDERDRKSKGPA